jgi:HAD superfamily hydrolase (TIGR01509 family)
MIDDMHYHIKAWHRILNELGASITREKMKEECYGKNAELLERMFPGRFSMEEKNHMSIEKEKQYQNEFRPQLALISGLVEFLAASHVAGIKMAIGSAAIMFNIDFVLDGLNIRKYFDALVSADNVSASKPDPETWLRCAEQLGVPSKDCLVFEDSPKGVDAALRAGMDCVVIQTMHTPEEFSSFPNVIKFIGDFNDMKFPL